MTITTTTTTRMKQHRCYSQNQSSSSLSLGRFLSLLVAVVIVHPYHCHANRDTARNIQLLNQCGSKVDVYWINRWNNDERVLNTRDGGLLYGADTQINSYIGHEFEIVERPNSKTNTCKNNECRKVVFKVNENEEQVLTLYKDFTYEHKDNKSIAHQQAKDILQACKAKAADKLVDSSDETSTKTAIDNLVSCVQAGLQTRLQTSQEEIIFQSKVRTKLATKFNDYACADVTLNTTSEVLRNDTRELKVDGRTKVVKVGVLHDRPESSIHYIPNFITTKECEMIDMLTTLSGQQQQESSSDGDDYFVDATTKLVGLSKSALVGKINFPSSSQSNDEKIRDLITRSFVMTSQIMPKISLEQDTLQLGDNTMYVMEYHSNSNEEYLLHCNYNDGCTMNANDNQENYNDADKQQYQIGNRIASLTMYCHVPTKGGSTVFPNAGGIHIAPEQGSAVFTSYVDLQQHANSDGVGGVVDPSDFTKHSECPIEEGTKKTITIHIQYNGSRQ